MTRSIARQLGHVQRVATSLDLLEFETEVYAAESEGGLVTAAMAFRHWASARFITSALLQLKEHPETAWRELRQWAMLETETTLFIDAFQSGAQHAGWGHKQMQVSTYSTLGLTWCAASTLLPASFSSPLGELIADEKRCRRAAIINLAGEEGLALGQLAVDLACMKFGRRPYSVARPETPHASVVEALKHGAPAAEMEVRVLEMLDWHVKRMGYWCG